MQDLRQLVGAYEMDRPGEVLRVKDAISLCYDVQAVAEELDRQGRAPIVLYENVVNHSLPVVSNVFASRELYAYAFGTDAYGLSATYRERLERRIAPIEVAEAGFRDVVCTGPQVDLATLPIPTFFPGDAGAYITAGLSVANDPDGAGATTMGFHRYQVKGADRLGVSLHSRRRMFEYQRRAEERGQNLPVAICLGLHPMFGLGALSYPPPAVSKYEVIGGLMGEPVELARCATIDVVVPAAAEIVIEGEILSGVREPEGPFGEFTGYQSHRSTQNVFQVKAISRREGAWFQAIAGGRAADHLQPLAILREASIEAAVRRSVPNVAAVCVPRSGCASFSAYVAIKQTRPGEAKHVIPAVLAVDHYLKTVVVVDDDVDVFNDSDVWWAINTRMQADRDLVTISGALGAILDPSTDTRGVTAKLGIDATRPVGSDYADRLLVSPDRQQFARTLLNRYQGR